MNRRIVGFVRDDMGDWVAMLDCSHRQHVRHAPPFRNAPWVQSDVERSRRVGTDLDCPLCDRAELPDDLEVVRTTETWDVETMPAGLRRAHRVAAGMWGLVHVVAGELRFRAATGPPIDTVVVSGTTQPIPPQVEHEVEPSRDARFFIEFLRDVGAVRKGRASDQLP
jgi:tellurite methyltransferase